MGMIVIVFLAVLLGAFLSSVAFGIIARELGFKLRETPKPLYYGVSSNLIARDTRDSLKVISANLKA